MKGFLSVEITMKYEEGGIDGDYKKWVLSSFVRSSNLCNHLNAALKYRRRVDSITKRKIEHLTKNIMQDLKTFDEIKARIKKCDEVPDQSNKEQKTIC